MPTPFPPNKTARHWSCVDRMGDTSLIDFKCCNCVKHGCAYAKHNSVCFNANAPKLKLTRKEIEEKVGGEFEIINEE